MKIKLKKKNCLIALIILLVIFFELVNPFKLYTSFKIQNLNYSKKSSYKIIEYGLKEEILGDEYNQFIDMNASSSNFNIDNYDIYKDINYYDVHDINLVNSLIEKGYNAEDINYILMTGTVDSINDLLEKDKYDNISKFLCYDYAQLINLERYIAYQRKTISNYDETVLHVEIGLDRDFYTDYNVIDKFSYTMLVNKYNGLTENYTPDNLVKVDDKYSDTDNYGNETMLQNFYLMADDLNKETGLNIYVRSGYRSYSDQVKTYDTYFRLYGQNYVNNYVAKPGFSEHQTGLAIDIKASSSDTFVGTKESAWLKENAYKYGFILRYTKVTEDITGYKDESWHYRYVGKNIAKDIYDKKMTFDEYTIKYLNK